MALCACLCLGGLQGTPLRSKTARQQCTIISDDVQLSLLSDVLCVSQVARILLTCFCFLTFLSMQTNQWTCWNEFLSLFAEEYDADIADKRDGNGSILHQSKSRSQTPPTTVDVTICCVVFLPPARLPRRCPGALQKAANLGGQKLHQHRFCPGQRGGATQLHSATGESQRCDKHVDRLPLQYCKHA